MTNIANDTNRSGMVRRLVTTLFSGRTVQRHLRTVLAFVLATALAMALSPAKAFAAVPEVRTPLHGGVEVSSPLAVFGSNIVLGTHRSTNGGASWTTDPALAGPVWSYTGNGKVVGYTSSAAPSSSTAVVYTVATGKSQSYPLPSFPQSLNDSWALVLSATGYVAYNFVTGQTSPLADPPTNLASASSWPQLTSSGGLLWTGYSDSGLMYAVASTPTAVPSDWVAIEDYSYTFTPTQFVYSHWDGASTQICARPLSNFTAAPTCVVAWAGLAQWSYSVSFYNFGATTIVDINTYTGTAFEGRSFSWNGAALKRLALPTGATISQPSAAGYGSTYGDTPYVVLRDSTTTVPSVVKVAANGTLQRGFSLPRTSAVSVSYLAVAPDRVVGGDTRDGSSYSTPTWVRSVSGSRFGAENMLPVRASWLVASAGRTIVSGTAGLTVYDRGVVKKTLSDARVSQLSGPYLSRVGYNVAADRGQMEISTVNGDAVTNILGTTGSLFGSEYFSWTSYASPVTVTIDDLTGVAPQRTVALAGDTSNCGGGQAWGDRLYMNCSNQLRMFSLTDGAALASLDAPAGSSLNLMAAGDGYAVVSANDVYDVWNVGTGALTPLTGCTYPVVTDGVGHVVCATSTDLLWRDFSALSKSAPRLLGTLAAASVSFATTPSWTLEQDTTKALKAGTVVISNATGTTVRTLPVPASADGSVRVAWDGLDAKGKPAPAGTYTYKLVAMGADGSGAVVSVTGTGTASGTIVVTAPACQRGAEAAHPDRGCHR